MISPILTNYYPYIPTTFDKTILSHVYPMFIPCLSHVYPIDVGKTMPSINSQSPFCWIFFTRCHGWINPDFLPGCHDGVDEVLHLLSFFFFKGAPSMATKDGSIGTILAEYPAW